MPPDTSGDGLSARGLCDPSIGSQTSCAGALHWTSVDRSTRQTSSGIKTGASTTESLAEGGTDAALSRDTRPGTPMSGRFTPRNAASTELRILEDDESELVTEDSDFAAAFADERLWQEVEDGAATLGG